MHNRKRIFLLVMVGAVSGLMILTGCSSAPRAKGYKDYPSWVRSAHDYVRDSQNYANKGRFVTPQAALEQFDHRLAKSDCYRIVTGYHQWGILEPESVFIGESLSDPSAPKAFIFVPPVLEDEATYPTPEDDKNFKIYRIDQDSPIGPRLVSVLEQIQGEQNQCIRFLRAPKDEQEETSVIAAEVQGKGSFKALPLSTLLPPVKEEPKKETKAEPKTEPKAEPKTESKTDPKPET